jgi:serine/threonine-protein kinase
MEYLQGANLEELVGEHGAQPPARVVHILRQICGSLGEAHGVGLIHRDIKPANLFVTTTGQLKILDFGIARLAEPSVEATQTGMMMGTPAFMPPEQARARWNEVDARSDIWALGVVLFELLTTKLPFNADSLPQLCAAVLNDPPASLIALRPKVGDALEGVVMKCLAKDPAERFRNVAELARALAPFAPSKSEPSVAQIVAVMEEAGQSVRPPRFDPVPISNAEDSVDTVREAPSPDNIGPTSISSPKVLPPKRSSRILAFGAAVAIVAGTLAIGYTARRSLRAKTASPPVAATAPASQSSPTTSMPVEQTSQGTVPPPLPPTASEGASTPPPVRRPQKSGTIPRVAGSSTVVATPPSVDEPSPPASAAPAATGSSATKRKFRTEY